MKRYLKHLQHALPWLLLLLGMDVFSSFLLWVVDSRAFPSLSAAILLTSLLLFSAVSAVLACRGNSREKAFLAFLETPDEYQEELLLKSLGASQAHAVRLLGANLRERRDACRHLETRLEEYEEYVESWAHETKMPLSLLSLLLDNRRDSLPEPVVYRLCAEPHAGIHRPDAVLCPPQKRPEGLSLRALSPAALHPGNSGGLPPPFGGKTVPDHPSLRRSPCIHGPPGAAVPDTAACQQFREIQRPVSRALL